MRCHLLHEPGLRSGNDGHWPMEAAAQERAPRFGSGRECDATLRHDQRLFGRTSFTSIEDHPALRARVAHNGGGQMTSVDGGCVTCRISTLRRRLGHEQ